MLSPTTVEEIVPIVDALSPSERARLIRLLTWTRRDVDSSVYAAIPPGPDEFYADEDPRSLDSERWESVA